MTPAAANGVYDVTTDGSATAPLEQLFYSVQQLPIVPASNSCLQLKGWVGDQRYTRGLPRIRQSLGEHSPCADDARLRWLSLQCLPGIVQMVLVTASKMTRDILASPAGAVVEVGSRAIPTTPTPSPVPALVHLSLATPYTQDTASSIGGPCREFPNLGGLNAASRAPSPRYRRSGCSC